jgi:formate dehydrogenase subunit delta
MSSDASHLVTMANQIADAFKASPEPEAVVGVANQIKSFWAPRLRQRLMDHIAKEPNVLSPVALKALQTMMVESAAA